MRVCVHVFACACRLKEEEEQGGSLSLILLSRFQVRQGEAGEDPGAAAPHGGERRGDINEDIWIMVLLNF